MSMATKAAVSRAAAPPRVTRGIGSRPAASIVRLGAGPFRKVTVREQCRATGHVVGHEHQCGACVADDPVPYTLVNAVAVRPDAGAVTGAGRWQTGSAGDFP